jgi:hypothetical protein
MLQRVPVSFLRRGMNLSFAGHSAAALRPFASVTALALPLSAPYGQLLTTLYTLLLPHTVVNLSSCTTSDVHHVGRR